MTAILSHQIMYPISGSRAQNLQLSQNKKCPCIVISTIIGLENMISPGE